MMMMKKDPEENANNTPNVGGNGGGNGGNRKQFKKIVPGAYECEIISSNIQTTQSGREIANINVDVVSGEYAGYFADRYQRFGRNRWGAVLKLLDWQQQVINDFIDAVEASNPGYKWDNQWEGLNGKLIGLSFQNVQYDSFYNDNGELIEGGWSVKPCYPYPIEMVRNGQVETPSELPLEAQTWRNKKNGQGQGQGQGQTQMPNQGAQAPNQYQQPQQAPQAQPQYQPVQGQPQYQQPQGQPQAPGQNYGASFNANNGNKPNNSNNAGGFDAGDDFFEVEEDGDLPF